jgi:hypothetical protein
MVLSLSRAGGAEAVGKLLAVIGEDLGDLERGDLEEVGQKTWCDGGGLLWRNLYRDPAGGARSMAANREQRCVSSGIRGKWLTSKSTPPGASSY